jgi:hypothetical protein
MPGYGFLKPRSGTHSGTGQTPEDLHVSEIQLCYLMWTLLDLLYGGVSERTGGKCGEGGQCLDLLQRTCSPYRSTIIQMNYNV